jgi:membrane protein required for beta-lactamase induction
MNLARTSFIREIFAGAIMIVVQFVYLAPLRNITFLFTLIVLLLLLVYLNPSARSPVLESHG